MVTTNIKVKCRKCKAIMGLKGQVKERICKECTPPMITRFGDNNGDERNASN